MALRRTDAEEAQGVGVEGMVSDMFLFSRETKRRLIAFDALPQDGLRMQECKCLLWWQFKLLDLLCLAIV